LNLRLGVIGCGWIAGRHARAAKDVGAVSIVACCDVQREVAEAWGREFGCERAYGDYLTMVREHELDAVLIATWPNSHHEQVLGCLDAGIRNILCEKALALTGAEALELWSAATAADALLVEAYMYRHHPAIRRIDDLLRAGEIGALDSVSAAFNLFDPEEASPDDPVRDWRRRAECAGGVPFDLACYCVDACNRFAGSPPRQVFAIGGTSARYGTVDRLYGVVEYENGIVGLLESSKRSDANYELRLSGARGHLRLPVAWMRDGPTEVVLSRSRGWAEFDTQRFPVPPADSFRLQLERFAAVVRAEAPPVPPLPESVVTAFTLDALLASAADGVPVPVEIPEAIHA
jgi:D-xylose 1-dehydrogenase (NADP+, D-xylono-1,5-lactone-forming)